jgi:hypothetical protein
MGLQRDFPPFGDGDGAPRLVVTKVIDLRPVKRESPGTRLSQKVLFE